MEAKSGWDPTLAKTDPKQTVELRLDTESFKEDRPVQTLRYIPVNEENKSLSWRTETGWLWFHIEQTPIAGDLDENLKTNLGDRDLTRLFTGETTVIVTNQRVGSLAVTKNVDVGDGTSSDRPDPHAAYHVTVTLALGEEPINDAVACEDSAYKLQSVQFKDGKAVLSLNAGQTITFPDLPAGTAWTVEETETLNSNNWETTVTSTGGTVTGKVASGKIENTNQNDTVNITNTYYAARPTKAEATIKVSKEYVEVESEGKTAYTGDVGFTLTPDSRNSAGDPLANSSPMTISITGKASKPFKTLEFTQAGTYTYTVSEVKGGVNGMTYDETVYTVTFKVERGADSDINKLVIKNGYPIYTVVKNPGDAPEPYPYPDAGLVFTNTYNPDSSEEQDKGSLSIHKTLENPKNATTGLPEKYKIKITLSHYDGISSSSQIGSSEPQSVTLNFAENGIATYYIKAGETLTLSDLPVGTQWTVTETEQLDSTYWRTAYKVNGQKTATVSDEISAAKETDAVIITNTYDPNGGEIVPGPGPGPNPGGNGGTPALNRRDHYAYIIGYPDGDVHPQGNITRAEVATIFFRLLRDPVRTQYWSQTNGYSDVPGNKWYNNAISTLSNMGIICGYPDGTFRPDAPITRAELTKIAAGFFSDPRVAATYDGRFSDVHGAEWYISYLMTALEEGLIEGYPDGSFRPNRPITRAETCTIVNRTLGRKPEKDHLLPESDMINWPDNINRNIWYYAQMQEATNSHDYRWISIGSEACEQWTAKLAERNWAALERAWSHANSAPGGEVMQ